VRLPLAAALVTGLITLPALAPPPTASAADGAEVAAAGASAGAPAGAPAARRAAARRVDLTRWATPAELGRGTMRGTTVHRGRVVLSQPQATRRLAGTRYDAGTWLSPWTAPGFDYSELIASWSARTPAASLVEVSVRGRAPDGTRSSWDTLARWAASDQHVKRTSLGSQDDDLASVNVDTWVARQDAGLRSWQLRVTLLRKAGTAAKPKLVSIGAMSSRLPTGAVTASTPGKARGVVLDVPRYSQMTHQGHSPQWGGGGQAWCSPTSTSMVLGHYGRLPRPAAYSWVGAGHTDPWVDHAARMTYDHSYRGTGNWPFNTAYAANLAGDAFVTRLTSMLQVERFILAGIPVVISVSFGRGQLAGAPISATNGHLLVVVGFTADGDVVVNDPAAGSRAGVRRTYDRGQLENAWLPRSGGLAYVIRDAAHPLPSPSPGNW